MTGEIGETEIVEEAVDPRYGWTIRKVATFVADLVQPACEWHVEIYLPKADSLIKIDCKDSRFADHIFDNLWNGALRIEIEEEVLARSNWVKSNTIVGMTIGEAQKKLATEREQEPDTLFSAAAGMAKTHAGLLK